jgi:hypothetical protein
VLELVNTWILYALYVSEEKSHTADWVLSLFFLQVISAPPPK